MKDAAAEGPASGGSGSEAGAEPLCGPEDEINFEEALKHVRTALAPPSIPSDVRQILADPRASNTDLTVG